MVADCQVVLQPEGGQHHSVSDGEGQSQFLPRVLLDVWANGWLHVPSARTTPSRPRGDVGRYTATWGHGRRGVARDRGMLVVHGVLQGQTQSHTTVQGQA